MRKLFFALSFALPMIAVFGLTGPAGASDKPDHKMKPFVLASSAPGDMKAVVAEVTGKLKGAGFEIAGSYSPYPTATVIAVTNGALKAAVAKSKFGGYGAAQRVSVTKVKDQIQVAYTNPTYMASAYRMKDNLADAAGRLEKALGKGKEYGPDDDDAMNDEDLRDYQYMFGMEDFTDHFLIGKRTSYQAAVDTVEKNLAAGVSGVTKVYRIDIPGKKETVFGVAMKGKTEKDQEQDDKYLMNEIDFKPVRSTAHLPYELLVSGNKVYSLSARFRIAINFPDLSMMGANSFMNIMGAPDAIRKALSVVAGGKK
jgi:hypothetical protein|tara:strand:- start:427 stop:1362 length:936 start_codon:yes stop_codon:yes gene_type:complete